MGLGSSPPFLPFGFIWHVVKDGEGPLSGASIAPWATEQGATSPQPSIPAPVHAINMGTVELLPAGGAAASLLHALVLLLVLLQRKREPGMTSTGIAAGLQLSRRRVVFCCKAVVAGVLQIWVAQIQPQLCPILSVPISLGPNWRRRWGIL